MSSVNPVTPDASIFWTADQVINTYTFEDSSFVIITSNKYDFTDNKQCGTWYYLSQDLIEELNPADDTKRIRVYTSLDEFNSDLVKNRSSQFEDILKLINGKDKNKIIHFIETDLTNDEYEYFKETGQSAFLEKVRDINAIEVTAGWADSDYDVYVDIVASIVLRERNGFFEKTYKVSLLYNYKDHIAYSCEIDEEI